ncbi:hypothetical protein MMC26_005648 [Xylographa opegraphella]|nr:hypothetical protein [Xylographa opegraphella]
MGVDRPFLYDRPSRYSFTGPTDKGFNPKAVSHASWTSRPAPQKRDGPLINSQELNRHPDSYFIFASRPYGQLDWKPLSRNTKDKVNWTRRVLRLFRVCALLAAAGLLVCVICVKGTDSTLGWIIRIAPGLAILHTVYAIYHLMRSSKDRTPSSSASYMLFAAIVDAGLIPFFVFTAMMARAQNTEPSDSAGHWGTLFGNDAATAKIILSTFLLSVVGGALLLLSLCISVYLAVMFRKIAKLPPDMNPLEDNLTSRHKRNKSSVSAPLMEFTDREKHLSAPLTDSPRAVPFLHTRTDSSDSQTTSHRRPGTDNRSSTTDLSAYQHHHPSSNHSCRATLSAPPNSTPPHPAPSSTSSQPPTSNRSSRTNFSRPIDPTTTTTLPSPPSLPHHPLKTYDFTNTPPRPLMMNPPTPPPATSRALQPANGNGRPRAHARGDSFGIVGDKARFYGSLYAGQGQGMGRVVSSGRWAAGEGMGMRVRGVSGKVAEEGRANCQF